MNNRSKLDLVVLFSGGADSTLLLKMAQTMGKTPIALMIDYGQLHIKELEVGKKFLEKYKIESMTVKIDGYNVNSGLTGSGEKGKYEGVHSHNVPARNSIFLSIAAGVAESRNIQEIWYGADWDDYENLFPDCYQSYIGRFNSLLEIAGATPIKVYAPLLGYTKEMVLTMLSNNYGITENVFFSGYGEFS